MKCNEKYEYNGVSLTKQQYYDLQLQAISRIENERAMYINNNILDSQKVIENLQKRGFINSTLYKGKYLRVPRGRFASDNIEMQALRAIQKANDNIKFKYSVNDNLLIPVKSEVGYNITVNQSVVTEANENLAKMHGQPYTQELINSTLSRILFETTSYMEQGADKNMKKLPDYEDSITGKTQKMILSKKTLLAHMKNQLAVVNSKLQTSRPSDAGHDNLLEMKEKLSLRIYGNGIKPGEAGYAANLTDEIAELEETEARTLAFDYMVRDLTQVENLLSELENEPLTEKHLDNLVQIKLILSFIDAYQKSVMHKGDNPLFTKAEWNLLITNKMPLKELVKLKDKADSQLKLVTKEKDGYNYIARFRKIEEKIIMDIANNDDRVKNLFGEESLKYSKMFQESMKDISLMDKFLGDNIVGTFSEFGVVPQIMRNLLQKEITKYMSKHTVWEEAINKQQHDVQKELNKLGFGVGPFSLLGSTYKLFRQTADNVKLTGSSTNVNMTRNLVQRQSNKFMMALESVNNAYWNVINETTQYEKRKIAYLNRNNWLRKNTVLVDPRKLEQIKNNPDFAQFQKYFLDDGGHKDELMRHLESEIGLKNTIDEQEKKIYDYIADFNRFTRSILSQAGVATVEELDIEYKKQLKLYEAEHNPFMAARAFSLGTTTNFKGEIRFPEMRTFNDFIPRRYSIEPDALPSVESGVNNGEITYPESGNDTEYYDKNFPTIENNEALRNFYNLTKEVLQGSSKMISPDKQLELTSNMFISAEKTVGEILLDPNVHIFKRFVPALQKIFDNVRAALQVGVEGKNVSDNIDPYDKTISPRVRMRYINSNQNIIQNKFDIYSRLFINTLSPELKTNFDKFGFTKKSTISLSAISEEGQAMIAEWLRVPNTTLDIADALNLAKVEEQVPVGILLHKFVVSQVVADESFNLPKILKLYSLGATTYAAKNEAMPMINILKDHYNAIAEQSLTNTNEQKQKEVIGKDGTSNFIKLSANQKVRTKAVANMEKWFERNTLDNIKPKAWGIIKLPSKKAGMTKEERKLYDEAQSIIDAEMKLHESRQNKDLIKKMQVIQASLGKEYAISALVDQMLDGVRFIGLGINPASAVKNYMAGKISNYINSLTGLYFTEDSLWRAEHVVMGSHAKLGTGIVKTKGARKAALLMTRFKVFQDATDEIYKSSVDSALKFQKISNWYFLQQRVEYVNQAPVLIAMLMDKKITGIDGTESSVWDAMKADGTFIDNFATDENNRTWVNAETTEFTHFKAKVDGAIKNIHGDYTTLGAPMSSDNQAFRATMMFKRWMIRYIHTRFAKEHFDSELGVKYKGRFRNYNEASLTAAAVTMAFTFAGVNLVALGLGVGVGLVGGAYFSSQNKQAEKDGEKIGKEESLETEEGEVTPVETPKEDPVVAQSFIKQTALMFRDFAFYTGQIAVQSILNPFKIIINTTVGKNIIPTVSFVGQKGDSEAAIRQHKDIQANLTEVSFLLTSLITRLILLKMFKMDDDEEEEDDDTLPNIIINMAGSLINEISQFYNPITTVEQSLSPALLKMSHNFWKLVQAMGEYDRVYTNGPYSGRSKVGVWAEKTLLPAAFRSQWGFNTTGRQVYDKFGVEKNFIPTNKRIADNITQVRSRFKNNLKKEMVKEYAPKEVVLEEAQKLMAKDSKLAKEDAVKQASKALDKRIDKLVQKYADKYCPTLTGYNDSPIPSMANYNVMTDNPEASDKKLDKLYEKEYENLIEQHLKTVEESIEDGTLFNDILAGEVPEIPRKR